MTFDKDGQILKQEGKSLVSRENGLVFMHGEVFKGGSRNFATFKMELFTTIGNGVETYKRLHLMGLQPIDGICMLLW